MTTSDTSNGSIERTLQLTGSTTFTVSLPKEWALDQGLSPGDPMHLYPHSDRVVVAPTALDCEERTRTIDASVGAEGACRLVRTAYESGIDRIEVTDPDGLDRDVRRGVTRLVDHLLGMEVGEETEDEIVARDLLDPAEISLSQSTAQIRQHALGTYEDAIDAFCRDDEALANRVLDRASDVDRLAAFVSRGVHRGLEDVAEIARFDADREAAIRCYRTSRRLERIGKSAERIATLAIRRREPPDERVADELRSIAADTRTVVERSLAGDLEEAFAAHARALESIEALEASTPERCDCDAHPYGAVIENARRAVDAGGGIASEWAER